MNGWFIRVRLSINWMMSRGTPMTLETPFEPWKHSTRGGVFFMGLNLNDSKHGGSPSLPCDSDEI